MNSCNEKKEVQYIQNSPPPASYKQLNPDVQTTQDDGDQSVRFGAVTDYSLESTNGGFPPPSPNVNVTTRFEPMEATDRNKANGPIEIRISIKVEVVGNNAPVMSTMTTNQTCADNRSYDNVGLDNSYPEAGNGQVISYDPYCDATRPSAEPGYADAGDEGCIIEYAAGAALPCVVNYAGMVDRDVPLNWWTYPSQPPCPLYLFERINSERAEAAFQRFGQRVIRDDLHYPPLLSPRKALTIVESGRWGAKVALLAVDEANVWRVSRAYTVKNQSKNKKTADAAIEERALMTALFREQWWMKGDCQGDFIVANNLVCTNTWAPLTEGCFKWSHMTEGNLDQLIAWMNTTKEYMPINRQLGRIVWPELHMNFHAYETPNCD